MNLDEAILLTKAWGREANVSFEEATILPNGDFRGVFGAAELIYSAQEKTLFAQGLIQQDASLMVEFPAYFEQFERAEKREPSTTGEGYFYVEPHPYESETPQLTLRREFRNGSMQPRQFVKEVDWLMEWSTYWRKQRAAEVRKKPEEELIQEAPQIEAWARKNRPRPW